MELLAFRLQLNVLQRSVRRPRLHRCGSIALGAAVAVVDRLAVAPGHRETGDADRLAPPGVSAVLDLESAPRPAGATACLLGNAKTDSPDESRETPMVAPCIHGELLKLGIDIG
jgi:hypothetical protein